MCGGRGIVLPNCFNLNVDESISLLRKFVTRHQQELVLTELVVNGNKRKRIVITDDGLVCYFCPKDISSLQSYCRISVVIKLISVVWKIDYTSKSPLTCHTLV